MKLKEAGPVQATNKNGDTALHLASLFGQRKVVQLLLREKAEVDAVVAATEAEDEREKEVFIPALA